MAWKPGFAALLTRHGKAAVVAPVLLRQAGMVVVSVDGFDTDSLGTFTRDIPRDGSQHETALKKARLACELSRLPAGLGSEGAFGAHPAAPWLPLNREVIAYVEPARNLVVYGEASSLRSNHAGAWLANEADLQAFAQRTGFPAQALVVSDTDLASASPAALATATIHKGLKAPAALAQAFAECRGRAGGAWVECDLRAHCCPARRRVIAAAARNLARRLCLRCPACGLPGYGTLRTLPGRRCRDCDMPTRLPAAREIGCRHCGQREQRALPLLADPRYCDACNP